MKKSSLKIRKGRPTNAGTENVRDLLLRAACEQFSTREFKAVSIKTISGAAGVNGAMVHYYFGDKRGLYLAMVEQIFAPMLANANVIEDEHFHSIEAFINAYTRLLAQNPWWPNFVVREVLFGDEEFRDLILAKVRDHLTPGLLKLIQSERDNGHFRKDLEPQLALLSLISMTVFPFLAKPLVENVLTMRVNEDAAQLLATHTYKLFLSGVTSQGLKSTIANKE